MNGIRRTLAALAGIAVALAAASAAFASLPPHGGGPADTPAPPVSYPCTPECSPGLDKHLILSHAHRTGTVYRVHTVEADGMPGWQIALIAIGAALLAATAAVLADRGRMARKAHATTA